MYWGRALPYFYHMYNLTHLNERMVEVAIAHDMLNSLPKGQRGVGVEVGNVLGHYEMRRHEVIDLHEPAAWYQKLVPQYVYNWDIFDPNRGLNGPWVISLSTIEHTTDPVRALARLRSMVDPGGRLLVTFPTGAHPALDELVEANFAGHPWTRACTLSRDGHDGWAQDPLPRVQAYGPWANTVAVLEWERPA